ncbi:MAG: hypothetical protein BWY00_01482 [Firmicutes bacterium ADurb.Bin153]|nr:MAG: hypothetical protein BWY00_01482 [Firmicutes bacterium ADurb.Bin153]
MTPMTGFLPIAWNTTPPSVAARTLPASPAMFAFTPTKASIKVINTLGAPSRTFLKKASKKPVASAIIMHMDIVITLPMTAFERMLEVKSENSLGNSFLESRFTTLAVCSTTSLPSTAIYLTVTPIDENIQDAISVTSMRNMKIQTG